MRIFYPKSQDNLKKNLIPMKIHHFTLYNTPTINGATAPIYFFFPYASLLYEQTWS
jgi:hypothetical protein